MDWLELGVVNAPDIGTGTICGPMMENIEPLCSGTIAVRESIFAEENYDTYIDAEDSASVLIDDGVTLKTALHSHYIGPLIGPFILITGKR